MFGYDLLFIDHSSSSTIQEPKKESQACDILVIGCLVAISLCFLLVSLHVRISVITTNDEKMYVKDIYIVAIPMPGTLSRNITAMTSAAMHRMVKTCIFYNLFPAFVLYCFTSHHVLLVKNGKPHISN
jgi:hypothetical protein